MPVTINGTTGIAGVDGSASTPSYQGTDTNTGIFYPAADTIAFAEGGTEVMRLDSSGNLLVGTTSASTPSSTGFISTANTFGFKNRIINGDMRIDQRNAGASVTVNTTGSTVFPVDRFFGSGITSAGVFTLQRSTTAPTGFTNSMIATVTTADSSIAASDLYYVTQIIEGFNVADLGFGSASAKTVTLSFWVRSSVTGTFSGALANGAYNRSYPFTYTISSANTFEYKTITITGDTSGTWLTDNGIGLRVYWNLGSGVDNTGTAGAWTGAGNVGADSTVALISTVNATFYITGVQLEVGTVATSFDVRDYGRELIMCQRYFQKSYRQLDAVGTVTQDGMFRMYMNGLSSFTVGQYNIFFKTSFRATPTLTGYSPETGASGKYRDYNASTDRDFTAYYTTTEVSAWQNASITGTTTPNIGAQWTASSEL